MLYCRVAGNGMNTSNSLSRDPTSHLATGRLRIVSNTRARARKSPPTRRNAEAGLGRVFGLARDDGTGQTTGLPGTRDQLPVLVVML